jgi:hypothetical protein
MKIMTGRVYHNLFYANKRYNPIEEHTLPTTSFAMLPDLQLKDIVSLRKPHPCGSHEWTVTRLGADIGLECCGCGHRIMLSRRELTRRVKSITPVNPPPEKST